MQKNIKNTINRYKKLNGLKDFCILTKKSKFYLSLFFIALMGIALSFFVVMNEKINIESQIISDSKEQVEEFESRFELILQKINSVSALYYASSYVDEYEFNTFVKYTLEEELPNIGWIEKVDGIYKILYNARIDGGKTHRGEDLSTNREIKLLIDEILVAGEPRLTNKIFGKEKVFVLYPVLRGKGFNKRQQGVILAEINFEKVMEVVSTDFPDLATYLIYPESDANKEGILLYKNGDIAQERGVENLLKPYAKFDRIVDVFGSKLQFHMGARGETYNISAEEEFMILFLITFIIFMAVVSFNSENSKREIILVQNERLKANEKKLQDANKELFERIDELEFARSELESSYESVRQAKEEADEANKAKSNFLANMSHELRTPMHAIINYSDMGLGKLEGAKYKDKLDKYLSNINKSGKRLLKIINDLLDLSKLEAKAVLLQPKQNDINEVITDVLNELYSLMDEKRISVEISDKSSSPEAVFDKEKIFHVVMNLLSNAIKFSEKTSVIELLIKDEVLGYEDGNYNALSFSVIDAGVGIPEDELDDVFSKFVQSSKTSTGAGGTGLGLSICKEIIESHRGVIFAKNNNGSGCCFTFIIPRDFIG